MAALGVDPAVGLAAEEAVRRQAQYGRNRLQSVATQSAWRIILAQFSSLVVELLGAAAAVAWLTGSHVESLAILIVLLINASIGFLTEWQAGRALLAERQSMLYLGTSVAAGRAVGVVTATGIRTELGRIGKLVAETKDESTPLKKRLDELGRNLVYLVLGIVTIVVLAGWWRGDDLWLMLETGISLAVAAVPEGLPAVTTLILALGVLRMARSNAIVRHLPAVETLGSATVICTEPCKRGTCKTRTGRDWPPWRARRRSLPASRPRINCASSRRCS